jgi:hypothetical protein
MPSWTSAYEGELRAFFRELTTALPARLRQVVTGRTTPALEALTIGSAREVAATVLFFDIEGSTNRTPTGRSEHLRTTLATLNCVIPMISRVVTDHGGYIEKNTGDGLTAIFGPCNSSANDALDTATTCFYVLREVVNPFLTMNGIAAVDARIGIDHGQILLARIGLYGSGGGSIPHTAIFDAFPKLWGARRGWRASHRHRTGGARGRRNRLAAAPPAWPQGRHHPVAGLADPHSGLRRTDLSRHQRTFSLH